MEATNNNPQPLDSSSLLPEDLEVALASSSSSLQLALADSKLLSKVVGLGLVNNNLNSKLQVLAGLVHNNLQQDLVANLNQQGSEPSNNNSLKDSEVVLEDKLKLHRQALEPALPALEEACLVKNHQWVQSAHLEELALVARAPAALVNKVGSDSSHSSPHSLVNKLNLSSNLEASLSKVSASSSNCKPSSSCFR